MVARHDGRALHFEHSPVGFRSVRAREPEIDVRVAATERQIRAWSAVRVGGEDDRSALRRAVPNLHLCSGECFVQAGEQLRGDRRRAHANAPDRREIGGGEAFRLSANEGEHGRDRCDQGASMPLDGIDIALGLESRQQYDGRSHCEGELGKGECVHVVEGGGDENPLGPIVDSRLPPFLDHPPVSAMGERHSLGWAARSRGVEDHRHLAGLGPDSRNLARGRKPAHLVESQAVDVGGQKYPGSSS